VAGIEAHPTSPHCCFFRNGQLLFQSPFLLVVGLAMLGGFVVLGKVYWFSVPLTGICISVACYVASIALSRA
jgi:hypothetical protein